MRPLYTAEKEHWERRGKTRDDFHNNTTAAHGRRFVKAVASEAMSGRMLLSETGRLLRMAPAKVMAFERRLKAGGIRDVSA